MTYDEWHTRSGGAPRWLYNQIIAIDKGMRIPPASPPITDIADPYKTNLSYSDALTPRQEARRAELAGWRH